MTVIEINGATEVADGVSNGVTNHANGHSNGRTGHIGHSNGHSNGYTSGPSNNGHSHAHSHAHSHGHSHAVKNGVKRSADDLIHSNDPKHPANLICELCRGFYKHGWVTGTGGGTSIRHEDHVYIAPSGVQKELMSPTDMFVMHYATRNYLRKPRVHKPSACTPLFLAAFDRGAGCCIHTHSQWAVLITLLVERDFGKEACFEIEEIEQIKGIPKGRGKQGNLGYYDRLRIPIIENTAHEEDLTESLEEAMDKYPDAYAVLVRRHGVYVWGDNVHKAKTQCESLDYIFQLAVEMKKLGLPWTKE